MQGTYIKFKCELEYHQIKFTSHIIADKEIIHYVEEHKNIKIGNDGDSLKLYDVHNQKIDEQTNIDPGSKITIERLPGMIPEEVKIPKQ